MINWYPGMTLEEVEKQVILKAFRFHNENKTHTAHALGVSVRTIQNKIEQYLGDKNANLQAESRIHVEPADKATEKSSVSVRKR